MSLASPSTVVSPDTLPAAQAGFGAATLIMTPEGDVPIEWLRAGDKVMTLDDGLQPIAWIGRDGLAAGISPRAVAIPAQTHTDSAHDLLLSPHHRILVAGWQLEMNFGVVQMLVEARHIASGTASFVNVPGSAEACYQIGFAKPTLVQANGFWVEATPMERRVMETLDAKSRCELSTNQTISIRDMAAPRPCLHAWEAEILGLPLPKLLMRATR